MVIFPGNVLVEMKPVTVKSNGIEVVSKKKRNRNIGKIAKSNEKFKKGDEVLFFARSGIIMGKKCLIRNDDVTLKFKNNMLPELNGKIVMFTPEEAPDELGSGIITNKAVTDKLPIGEVITVGDEVTKFKAGDRIFVHKERMINVTEFNLLGKGDRYDVRLINEADILMKLGKPEKLIKK